MRLGFARTPMVWLGCVVTLILSSFTAALKTGVASPQSGTAPAADIQINDTRPYPFRFVAYGDMRFAEHEFYGKVIANAEARQQVIDQIAKENPAFLLISGDLVFRGFYEKDWTYYERGIKPVKDRGIEIFPAIGTHEVGPFQKAAYGPETFLEIENETEERVRARGLKNYYKEFPQISGKPWYSVRYANCYFLVLDSEIKDEQSDAAQKQWIRAHLDSVPREVDYIFVILHQPPYTAMADELHKPQPAQIALRELLEARQQNIRARIIVIAGHVHNYERYEHGGVAYIVSGGGGAAKAEFARAADDLYPKNALYGKNDPANEDQYHYCVLTVEHSKLKFQMMKLVSKGKNVLFEPRDSFELDRAAN